MGQLGAERALGIAFETTHGRGNGHQVSSKGSVAGLRPGRVARGPVSQVNGACTILGGLIKLGKVKLVNLLGDVRDDGRKELDQA